MTSDGLPSNGRVIRCLIADDQAMVREGFAAMLAAKWRANAGPPRVFATARLSGS